MNTQSSAPYSKPEINQIYHLLFCDDFEAFRPKADKELAPWQSILFNKQVDPEAVRSIANDLRVEGRIRALAFNWLRSNGFEVPKKILLGVIVEVPLTGGLDVLAGYPDGGVRYINQTGKLAVIEGGLPAITPKLSAMLSAAQTIVNKIGPWDKQRLPPPKPGNIRFTFLVSDGLYFGEGPMSVMQSEPMAAPLIHAATNLLQTVVQAGTK